MDGYVLVNLKDLIEQIGEKDARSVLSNFYCPLNLDVQGYLRNNAIEFARQGIASTHLVFTSYKEAPVLIGYFTLANKTIRVPADKVSKSLGKRLNKFSQDRSQTRGTKDYIISAPLIGQLGKNFSNEYNKLISGDVLIKIALDKVREGQRIWGGKIVYLECEENARLIEFYRSNGFYSFGKRTLDRDERSVQKGSELVQMLKYLHDESE